MSWFTKKKNNNKVEEVSTLYVPKECEHFWWDSSPYFIFSWNVYYSEANKKREKEKQLGRLVTKIYETYICCKCKQRNDEVLQTIEIEDITRNNALIEIEKQKEEYKNFCKPRAEVEDEINDLIYGIDRNLLQTIALYQPQKVGSVINSNVNIPILDKFLKEN